MGKRAGAQRAAQLAVRLGAYHGAASLLQLALSHPRAANGTHTRCMLVRVGGRAGPQRADEARPIVSSPRPTLDPLSQPLSCPLSLSRRASRHTTPHPT